jgi:hypothetical protein
MAIVTGPDCVRLVFNLSSHWQFPPNILGGTNSLVALRGLDGWALYNSADGLIQQTAERWRRPGVCDKTNARRTTALCNRDRTVMIRARTSV